MRYYGITDKGLIRETNQDNYVIASNVVGDVFALVCDGIGGGRGGDVASKIAVDYFSEVFSQNEGFLNQEDIIQWVKKHVSIANDEIFTQSTKTKELTGMGTTLVGVLLTKVGRVIVNMGDSRVYSVINHDLKRITTDHTLVQDLLQSGEITYQEAENHPKKNILTNALGVWDTTRVDVFETQDSAESFLICSDGLYGYVEHEEIKKVMFNEKLTTGRKVKELMKLALNVGGYDNITIILMELEGSDT